MADQEVEKVDHLKRWLLWQKLGLIGSCDHEFEGGRRQQVCRWCGYHRPSPMIRSVEERMDRLWDRGF